MTRLFLIPTTLSNTISHNVVLPTQLTMIAHVRYFIVETAKIARQHLKLLNLATPIQELDIQELNKHKQNLAQLIAPLLKGYDVGILSDCGMPAIADPGSSIVRLAHEQSTKHNVIEIVPLSGPSSLFMGLMSSGVNGQSFAFTGYLPIDKQLRIDKIKQLEKLILNDQQSQIIIETPFRNQALLTDLIANLNSKVRLAVNINLMQSNQKIISQTIANWQKMAALPQIHKHEAVFILGC